MSTDRFRVDPDDYLWMDDDVDSEGANRPRTKKRPEHVDAKPGLVIGVDRGRYRVHVDGTDPDAHTVATRARELRRESIVVGDLVDVVGDTSGVDGSLSRIVRVTPRRNVLRRSADDSDQFERVIVANADQLLMVVAAAHPEPRLRLIDRYIVAALDAGIDPVLVVTKTDLASADTLIDHVTPLGISYFTVSPEGGQADIDRIIGGLRGKMSVLVGHSGVGKSTLVNRLVPDAYRAVGDVNAHTGRGRHTSSSSVALRIDGGWIVDTPGVRSFGLGHVTADSIQAGFEDLSEFLTACPKACRHGLDQADCGLVQADQAGELSDRLLARAASLRLLLGHTASSETA